MDLGRLRTGELLAGGSAAALLVVLFALDWFSFSEAGATGWEALEVVRFLLLAVAGLAFTLVALTVLARPVAMPVAAAVILTGTAAIATLVVFFRVGLNEPGPNEFVEVELGAYLGLALTAAIAAGGWRTMQDERTNAPDSIRQTERVLAVRGAPRPVPDEPDEQPDPPEDTDGTGDVGRL